MKVSEKLSVCFLVEKSEMSKDGRAPIYVRFTLDGQRKEFSLGAKIFPDQWDMEGSRVISQSPEALLINAQITQAKARLEKLFLVLSAQFESITADMLKRSYQGKTVKGPDEKEPEIHTLIEALDFYINRFKEKVDKSNRSVRTLRKWNATKDKVSGFLLDTHRKRDIALKAVKPGYAEDIYHYLTTEDGLSHNSAMKYIKNIRQVFRFALGRWITTNPFTAFICSYLQPNRDYLTMPEIVRLYHQPMIKRLDRIRDVFLFSCFTGLAYQELALISANDIIEGSDGYKWIRFDRIKTGSPEDVPLLPIPETILEKYNDDKECLVNNRLLPVISNQKYNDYLKEIAALCGFHKTITTHSARHTFATTVTLENGVPIKTVSKMLAHGSVRVTQIYARITRKKVSEDMRDLRKKLFSPTGKLKAAKQTVKAIEKIRQMNVAIAKVAG